MNVYVYFVKRHYNINNCNRISSFHQSFAVGVLNNRRQISICKNSSVHNKYLFITVSHHRLGRRTSYIAFNRIILFRTLKVNKIVANILPEYGTQSVIRSGTVRIANRYSVHNVLKGNIRI